MLSKKYINERFESLVKDGTQFFFMEHVSYGNAHLKYIV
jgi:hypothetical protein